MIATESNDLGAKTTPPEPTRPLLPVWIAYPASGLTFVAAAYLWTAIPAFLTLYSDLGVAIPALVHLQLSFPLLLPLGMVVVGGLALLATRVPTTIQRGRSGRSLAAVGAVGLCLGSILMVLLNTMTVRGLQRGLGDAEAFQSQHVNERFAWAQKLDAGVPTAKASGGAVKRGPRDHTYVNAIGFPLGVRVEIFGKSLDRHVRVEKGVAANKIEASYRWHLVRTEIAAEIVCRATGAKLLREGNSWIVSRRTRPPLPKRIRVSLAVTDASFAKALARIEARVGRKVEVDPALKAERLTLRVSAIPYWEALWILTRMTGTELELRTDGTYLLRKGSKAPVSFVNVAAAKATLRTTLDRVQGVTGLRIACDADLEKVPVPVDLERIPTSEIPEALARLVEARVAKGVNGSLRLTRSPK